jgi:folate-binding protein YgfZ
MPRVAYDDAALTVWQGSDALQFIDGLSSNKIVDMVQGEVRQTVFTSTQAKIVDLATVFHMGDFLAVQSHKSQLEVLLQHVTPRILDQEVTISDVTSRNIFCIDYGAENSNVGTFESLKGVTHGYIAEKYSLLIASIDIEYLCNGDLKAFHEWRIGNQIPWNGYEITKKNHPLSVGLGRLVHPAKGCYIGQEVLARMISRGRQGKIFVRVENGTVDEKYITTKGENYSLAIIRESNQ